MILVPRGAKLWGIQKKLNIEKKMDSENFGISDVEICLLSSHST